MSRPLVLSFAAAALALLAACSPLYTQDPQLSTDSLSIVAPAGSMLSTSSLILTAGSSATVTFGLRLHCAPGASEGLTPDGCQYLRDGVERPHAENIWVSMAITSYYHDDDGSLIEDPYYPGTVNIPGLTFTFGQDPLVMEPEDGKITTTTLTVTADATVAPGSYTVYVGKSVGSSVLDRNTKQPLTVHVLEPSGPMTSLHGTITNHDTGLENPVVVLRRETDMVSAPVNPVGLFAAELPEPETLHPFDYAACSGTMSDPATLHSSGSVLLEADNLDYPYWLNTAGPEGYDLLFLLYVDRAVTINMECESDGFTGSESYSFPAAGWYPVFFREHESGTDYTAATAAALSGNWTMVDPMATGY